MATNDFLAFAADPAADVMLQSDYADVGFTPRILGFQTGTALSVQLNKVWRQASMISAMIGQFSVDETGLDAIDDGSSSGQATLLANFKTAVHTAGGAGLAGNYLPLAGGTLSGALTITAGANQLNINGTTGQHAVMAFNRNPGLVARIQGASNNTLRWHIDFPTLTPETGNNIGSDFQISRFSDSGVLLDNPITISRATGVVNFSQPPTVSGGPLPYVPISGGRMTGGLGSPGISYNYGGYAHFFQMYWDGSWPHIIVDGADEGQVANAAWVQSVVGGYLPLTGGTLQSPGNLDVEGSMWVTGGAWFRSTVYFANLGDFANFTSGTWRYRQWAGNWYDAWNGANGTRVWVVSSGANMTLDPSANLAISGTLRVYGGRLAVGEYGSISVYHPSGTAQGLWADTDGMWFGWNDTNANPTRGMLRLGNDGVLASWYGIISYNWLQVTQWASIGGNASVGGNLWVGGGGISNTGSGDTAGNQHVGGQLWVDGQTVANGPAVMNQTVNAYGPGRSMVHSNQPAFGLDFIGNYAMGMCINYAFGAALVFTMMDAGANPTGWLGFLNTAGVWGGAYFQTVSGRALKKNIEPARAFDSLDAIRRVPTFSYDTKEHNVHREFGFIAEELADLLPDVVQDPGEGPMLDIMALIAHAYRAIAQLAERIDR